MNKQCEHIITRGNHPPKRCKNKLYGERKYCAMHSGGYKSAQLIRMGFWLRKNNPEMYHKILNILNEEEV